ncbi:putative plastidic glucose transporter 2 [Capsicum annuum]|uniref:Plastidic glucose transporter 2 n=1 Tax=Capsicum annuum TaxID=4072 RepID=A0A2G2Z1A3_CAPAN|nr:probable plastidic glucose transporter 2 [Capsicum annuum]XP_047249728.1 probable plastidic glucose transporter 2 [Capsicum annuum]XP_047249729.1 probable plastidic glucose transporter 2 [Capsicum annuum]XP_047249730.1 probable plastidic glucose transporter 2 [Capsicum annuum]XP_047249731.1 probable plastidic glucose transporter 2 [Capsicum annuum]XP_047249732.1 probable plastidic glucose transporter 2 [Capsicum annuum]XP_047249733.1 probable plastidic glucose transporter 2 [Capsicum annuu
MWGHLRASSLMYKRMTSRDPMNAGLDVDSDLLQNDVEQEMTNPSWKFSCPHVLVATIVAFLFGYHLGVVNEPLESISVDLGFSGDMLAEGLVVSTCLAAAFAGSLVSGWIADGVGRRRAFQLCSLPMIIGASLCATAQTLAGMLAGRFLVGLGLGVGPPVASLYVAEVSPAHVRGTYGSLIQIATCLGLMAALVIGIPIKNIVSWWRVCFWVSTIPAAILALAMTFCVESPHWLYKQGRLAEAEGELERLLGSSHVNSAMLELSKSDRGDEIESVKISELLHGPHSRVVYIGATLFALQQLSGINAVFYFSSTVFRRAGVSSNLANVFVGIANLTGSIVALVLMDKLGRKVLLHWSFFGMALSMALQVFASSGIASNYGAFYFSVGGMLLFVLTFAVGAGPVPGLLLPEIFPSRIRAKAMAFCMSVHWVANFFVGLMFLRLLDQLGPHLLYSIFGTFCVMAAVFVKRNVMETKGKSLQEIEIALLPQE